MTMKMIMRKQCGLERFCKNSRHPEPPARAGEVPNDDKWHLIRSIRYHPFGPTDGKDFGTPLFPGPPVMRVMTDEDEDGPP
eukprot:10083277-Karenia_brevis.AAC.1